MVGATDTLPWALFLLAQDRAQAPPDKPVELAEGGVMGMLEVAEPAAQQWVEILHGAGEAVSACAASASSRVRHRMTKSSAYRTMRRPRSAMAASSGSR